MKKLLIMILLFLTPVCQAAVNFYPFKITDFSTYSSFQNSYLKIYQDTHVEDWAEILSRVEQHILEEKLTNDEKSTLCNLDVSQVSYLKKFSKKEQVDKSAQLQYWCEYEKNLLRFQNDLSRRNSLRGIFSDDTLSNSPFDIINDLRAIDGLIAGEKYEIQKTDEPTFLKYKKIEKFVLDPELWQDQREEALEKEFGNKFSDNNYFDFRSITGNLAGINEPLEIINSYPLLCEDATERLFQTTFEGFSAGMGGAISHITAPADKAIPESEEIKEKNFGEKFTGLLRGVLSESSCTNTETTRKGAISDDLAQFWKCGLLHEENLNNILSNFQEQSEVESEKKHKERILPMIKNFNIDMTAFRKSVKWLHDKFKYEFLTKDKR